MNTAAVDVRQHTAEWGDRHVPAALAAIVLSVLAHAAVLYLAADARLGVSRFRRPLPDPDRSRPPLLVERLPVDPERVAGAERARGADGAGPAALAARARDLARPPDTVLLSPPALSREALAGTLIHPQAPARSPAAVPWEPRQQLLAVMDRRVRDDLATLPRREILRIERVPHAPDYVPAVDLARDRFGEAARLIPSQGTGTQALDRAASGLAGRGPAAGTRLPSEADSTAVTDRFGDRTAAAGDRRPLDDRLTARLSVYRHPADRERVYFRTRIARRDGAVLPVAAKDVLLVQDCSNSLAEERLHFCRQAMIDCLARLGPEDRFNVFGFRDRAERLFPDWVAVTPANTNAAAAFFAAMRSAGDTDVFGSLSGLLELPRDPRRPLVALVVTDGRPTAGLTASTRIIGEFSRLSDGRLSVFTLGTHGKANAYLLDMLAYCNRGNTALVRTGRWDIPAAILSLVESLRRPVLTDIACRADSASRAELHPALPPNLYADRPLDLYGSCAAEARSVILQVCGRAGAAECDVVFDLPLDAAESGDASIRDQWARQRMYDLMGSYARQPREELLAEMYRHSRRYGLPIPYRKEL